MDNVMRNDEIRLLMAEKIRLTLNPDAEEVDDGTIIERLDAIEARLRELRAYG